MAYHQIWTCDLCQHEQCQSMEPRKLYEMSIAADRADRRYGSHKLLTTLVCEDCLKERKLYNPEPTRAEPQYVTTFEDMLREIIREEIEAKG